jgi:ABC-type lipoprotein release transport system permease subunit
LDLETCGFVIGLVGAIWMKSSLNLMQRQREQQQIAVLRTMGREPEEPALKAFLRGLALVLVGLGVETYARLFL